MLPSTKEHPLLARDGALGLLGFGASASHKELGLTASGRQGPPRFDLASPLYLAGFGHVAKTYPSAELQRKQ